MDVQFKESNHAFYKILEIDQESYLLDVTSISPKTYFWGHLPQEISGNMVKVGSKVKAFEGLAPSLGRSPAVLVGLTIAIPLTRMTDGLFRTYGVSQNLPLKLGLFALSILVAYLIFWLIAYSVRFRVGQKLPKKSPRYRIVFEATKSRRQGMFYKALAIYLALSLGIFACYLILNNRTESGLLIIHCLLSLAFFTLFLGILPIRDCYEKGEVRFKKLEKL